MNLTLSYPTITGNTVWRHAKGKTYINPKAKDYYNLIAWELLSHKAAIGLAIPLQVSLKLYPPDNRKRDMDNLIKILHDALTKGGLWQDDSLVRKLTVEWMDKVKGGKIEMSVDAYP
jgi:crossover junction endodeoxyribonuclease RusA